MNDNIFAALKEQAVKDFGPGGFRVILKDEFEYNNSREISNAYFDKRPGAVAFPRTTRHVQACIKYCIDKGQPFRTRSGGHQHEGMSSLNEGLMIRLSDMSLIEYCDDNKNEAWIDSGMKLGSVYSELARHDKVIPAGGCSNVNVGGITQGGGWGLHARQYGLTCDRLRAAEIVLADGTSHVVSAENKPDLFWALRGGGGGNFGIVTRFKFELCELGIYQSRFYFSWRQSKIKQVAKAWLDLQKGFDKALTSFVRIAVTDADAPGPELDDSGKKIEYQPNQYPIYAGGLFYGEESKLREIMKPLCRLVPPDKTVYTQPRPRNIGLAAGTNETDSASADEFSIIDLFGYDDFASVTAVMETSQEDDSTCNVKPPAITCNAPHPHKVSSAFPTEGASEYNERLAKAVADYTTKDGYDHRFVRSYMTFHAMGGAISKQPDKTGAAFAFRDKSFLLQFQSWWDYPVGKANECRDTSAQREYIDWVIGFRKTLADAGLVEGAFINFVDKDLPIYTKEGDTEADLRKKLLRHYYAGNLDELIRVKRSYDPQNRFNFEMSIPL